MRSSPSRLPGSQARFVLTKLLPLAFMIAGAIAAYLGFRNIFLAKASASWPSSQGSIIASSVESYLSGNAGSRNTAYHVNIQYRFAVGGATYTGHRVAYGATDYNDPKDAYEMANSYRRGQKVSVYYHPENPKESLLKPGVHASAWFLPLAGLVFLASGIFLPRLLNKANVPGRIPQ